MSMSTPTPTPNTDIFNQIPIVDAMTKGMNYQLSIKVKRLNRCFYRSIQRLHRTVIRKLRSIDCISDRLKDKDLVELAYFLNGYQNCNLTGIKIMDNNVSKGRYKVSFISDQVTWYRNNQLHRDHGAAVIKWDGSTKIFESWYRDGRPHRENGPVMFSWFINGTEMVIRYES